MRPKGAEDYWSIYSGKWPPRRITRTENNIGVVLGAMLLLKSSKIRINSTSLGQAPTSKLRGIRYYRPSKSLTDFTSILSKMRSLRVRKPENSTTKHS